VNQGVNCEVVLCVPCKTLRILWSRVTVMPDEQCGKSRRLGCASHGLDGSRCL